MSLLCSAGVLSVKSRKKREKRKKHKDAGETPAVPEKTAALRA